MITDSIGNYLTSIRNAIQAQHKVVNVPSSNVKKEITKVLMDQGYILNYKFMTEGNKESIKIALKFTHLSSINPIQEDDQLKKLLLDEWSENDVIEIIGVIALFGFLNRWNDIMGTKLEDGAIEHSRNYLSDFGWEIGKHN